LRQQDGRSHRFAIPGLAKKLKMLMPIPQWDVGGPTVSLKTYKQPSLEVKVPSRLEWLGETEAAAHGARVSGPISRGNAVPNHGPPPKELT
jgi:hypothetical protein